MASAFNFDFSARQKANISAVKAVARILRPMLGPNGQIMEFWSPDGLVKTTKGAAILEYMAVHNQIAKLMLDLSRSQDYEIGDGTTAAVVMANELLEQAEQLIKKGYQSDPIKVAEGYERACKIAVLHLESIASKFEVNGMFEHTLRETCATTLFPLTGFECKHLLPLTGFECKHLAWIAVEAVLVVADLDRKDVNLDLIKVEGKVGGKLEDTKVIYGIIVDKVILDNYRSHSQMNIRNANIAFLKFDSALSKVDEMVQKCKKFGATLLICHVDFDNANLLLKHRNQIAIHLVSSVEELERIAIATGGRIVSWRQQMNLQKLGRAYCVSENTEDNVIYIEGLANPRATIVTRGGDKVLICEVERNIHAAMCVARNLIRENFRVTGGGSAEIACSIAVEAVADQYSGVEQDAIRAFAAALDSVPLALAKNSSLSPIETLAAVKSQQIKEKKSCFGINYTKFGTTDMCEKGVFESLIVKKHQIVLATQIVKMILGGGMLSKDTRYCKCNCIGHIKTFVENSNMYGKMKLIDESLNENGGMVKENLDEKDIHWKDLIKLGLHIGESTPLFDSVKKRGGLKHWVIGVSCCYFLGGCIIVLKYSRKYLYQLSLTFIFMIIVLGWVMMFLKEEEK